MSSVSNMSEVSNVIIYSLTPLIPVILLIPIINAYDTCYFGTSSTLAILIFY